jgi:hypothetical protein
MQQSCTYGSVRGASGQPASLPRQQSAETGDLRNVLVVILCMAMGRRRAKQQGLWISAAEMPRTAAHPY